MWRFGNVATGPRDRRGAQHAYSRYSKRLLCDPSQKENDRSADPAATMTAVFSPLCSRGQSVRLRQGKRLSPRHHDSSPVTPRRNASTTAQPPCRLPILKHSAAKHNRLASLIPTARLNRRGAIDTHTRIEAGEHDMQIYGPSQVHGAQSLKGPHNGRGPASAGGPSASRGADEVQFSAAAEEAANAAEAGEFRSDLVARVRAEISAGTYETPDKLDAAMQRLLDEIG
ncbi:MAG: hypothetical protein CMJ58_04700 [Planctomycetaceae bacterium]|nr:hypothetical protein [Planctomycetaceae bacterium]